MALLLFPGIGSSGCLSLSPYQDVRQKIDLMQAAHLEMAIQVADLDRELANLAGDMDQVKQILPQMSNLLAIQQDTYDRLEAAFQAQHPRKLKK